MAAKSMQFASFTLDLDRLCLFGPSGQADLRPKSFEVLRYLVEHAGRVVGKEEVIKAVWPDVVVTDESLTRCISDIRRALGDADQQIIKTVPRRGYLIDALVSACTVAAPASAPIRTNAAVAMVPSPELAPKAERDAIEGGARVGERKQVTVLCADLKETLERFAERDAEEALKIFEAVLPLMREAVTRYGGTVNVTTGYGITALFGAPVAHEDHAVHACLAALELQGSVGRCGRALQQAGIPIRVRAGLNSGEVVIRSVANGQGTECLAMGQTIHLADRLAKAAAPGTLLVSAETLRLAEGRVRVNALERANETSKSVYELVAAEPARTRFQALAARGLTSFVGRGAELEQFERVRAKAEQGHGQVVTIIGEPGLGKSRLLHELLSSYRTSHWLVLEAASVSYRRPTNYQPVIDLLRAYFKVEDGDEIGMVRSKVVGRLLRLDQALAPDLPALLSLLDIPVEYSSWQALEPLQRRQRTLEALKRLFLRQSQQTPMILAIEDVHWLDSETQAFLNTLIDALASASLLLILTYRPEYQHRWGSKSYYTQLRLDALSRETTEEFLHHLLGDDASLNYLKDRLRTQGNPLFLEESIRSLVETNVLAGCRGHYHLVPPLQELRIPPTVQAILAARIDRLQPRAKQLLQAASVVGTDVPYVILQPIAGLAEDEARVALSELREAELLYEARVVPDVEYTFKHALTHDVAYVSLLAEQRDAIHRQIVDVIERLYPDRLIEHVEQLAHHALRGELWEKAVLYQRQAAAKAEARSATENARDWLEHSLGALQKLPESQSTLEHSFEIRIELRQVLTQLSEYGALLKRLREAEAIAERLHDDHRRARASAFMTNIHSFLEQLDEALAMGARALNLAEGLGDLRLRIVTATLLTHPYYLQGEYERAVELATATLEALPSGSICERFGVAVPPSVFNRGFLTMSLAQLGNFHKAVECAAEAIRIAESTQHVHTLGFAYRAAVVLHLLQGNWAKARSRIESWIATMSGQGHFIQLSTAFASWAWVLARLGQVNEALDRLQESEELLERRIAKGIISYRGWDYHAQGRAYLLLGRVEEARKLGIQAVQFTPSQPGYAAHALCLLGDVATCLDRFNPNAGRRYYRRALRLAEPRGMRPLVAHCYRGLGELYRRTGEVSNADQHLATAATMYREMGMRFWLEETDAEIKT